MGNWVLTILSDYDIGAFGNIDIKGKFLDADYEPYIMAFFHWPVPL